MTRRWLLILLSILLASCSGTGKTSPPPNQTDTIASPTILPTQVEASKTMMPTSTATMPSPSEEAISIPIPTHTHTPVPAKTIAPLPTSPQTILPNANGIIAKFIGGPKSFIVVGGSQDGNWISAQDVAGVLSVDTEYQIESAFDSMGWIPGQEIVHEHICDQYYIDLDPFYTGASAVGVSGDWSIRLREPLEISTDSEVYSQALASWLVEQAPSQPIVALNRIWRVDLEGNGTEEVIINATRFAESSGHDVEPRDYSVVLLRTVIGSEVVTIELVGDYYSEAVENQFPLTYNLEFVGDLNGDGKMEVVVGISRWEGSGVMVFEIDEDEVQLVLSAMCSL